MALQGAWYALAMAQLASASAARAAVSILSSLPTPVFLVQAAVVYGFGQVLCFYFIAACQVGYGTAYFKYTVISTGA